MELIHIANATFSSLRKNHHLSLENLASKQKLFRIVKEQTMRSSASLADHTTNRAITPAHVGTVTAVPMSSRHHASLALVGGGVELVEPAGIEPATSWLQTRRSPS